MVRTFMPFKLVHNESFSSSTLEYTVLGLYALGDCPITQGVIFSQIVMFFFIVFLKANLTDNSTNELDILHVNRL